jgi:nicotinate phosphoribosyltransferase
MKKIFIKLDKEKIMNKTFSDCYFERTCDILKKDGKGDIEVEMQFFTRRKPISIIAGMYFVLELLKENNITDIEYVEDGYRSYYIDSSYDVEPILKIRGKYTEIGYLETIILGYLTECSKIATNTYNCLVASTGKPILFFPARFALPSSQEYHGYAYSIGVDAYNNYHGRNVKKYVSTKKQAFYCSDAIISGTTAHASIACYEGKVEELMEAYDKYLDESIPRIALVDFNNNSCDDTIKTINKIGKKLDGVRLDTSGSMKDECINANGEKSKICGVNKELVLKVKQILDKNMKVIVTGGFNVDKIKDFENCGVPADIYGVGSYMLTGNNDFTGDIVRIKKNGEWINMHKKGRRICKNKDLIKRI